MMTCRFPLFAPILLLLAVSLVSPSSAGAALSWEGTPDVIYVRTPHPVVDEILRIADVRASDVVYDLGCGDGRIVITAARDMGARGVGIDIDPLRVEESFRNAQRAGVADRVRLVQGDLFTFDFSEASVVFLYLLPDLNLRLRPELFRQLKPGTRVVSHKFDMGDWTPDEESSVGRSRIYYWMIPANASGRWEWSAPGAQGEQTHQLRIEQKFQTVEASLHRGAGALEASRASLTGERLVLEFEQGTDGTIVFEGRIAGDTIEGNVALSGGEPAPWRASRVPGTMTALEAGR